MDDIISRDEMSDCFMNDGIFPGPVGRGQNDTLKDFHELISHESMQRKFQIQGQVYELHETPYWINYDGWLAVSVSE